MKAIIIGASTGIGYSLAKVLAANGYELGLMARRTNLLEDLSRELKVKTAIRAIDIAHDTASIEGLNALIREMGGVDLIVVNAAVRYKNPELDWAKEKEMIEVNVLGFSAMAGVAMKHFRARGRGHLVGMSSMSAFRGHKDTAAYNASKAYVSNYLEGLRHGVLHTEITVTEIKPGFVNTPMILPGTKGYWMSSSDQAAEQIFEAIQRKKMCAYITKRWCLMGWLLGLAPLSFYYRFLALK